jgi:hypothetical protein
MMKATTTKNTVILIAAAALAALAIGCNNKTEEGVNAIFRPAGEERVSKFGDVQASNGARSDAMLYGHHFTAGHLNSLGRSKVLLMLEDCENCEPIVVHLVNAGEGELLEQRKASVELYLKTAEGPNKLAFHPAAPNLVRFAKTESGRLEDQGLPAVPQGATPPPAPMK